MTATTNRTGFWLSGAVLLGGAMLLVGPRGLGYTFLGGMLDLTQRDVRVFNNFSGALANDNTTPDLSFPGAVGAPLAIWKAAVEWGSQRHGDGFGDPLQQGGLGSGGADFDYTWQGAATSPGGVDDNIVSEISGSSLGTLAFTDLPISDGWRIRFYGNAAIWEDGPGPTPNIMFHADIQGVAAHELGHALGLGHSSFSDQVTMFGSASGIHNEKRSIESDDIAGVQALYGAKSASKPSITSYALNGATMTIFGARFDSAQNDVWFTNGAPTADGTPLVVSSIAASMSGTQITLAIPALAWPGDVLVRIPGASGAALSNAFPFDPLVPPCAEPVVYGTGKTTSSGLVPTLSFTGRPRASTNDFMIQLDEGIAGASAILFSGRAQNAAPFFGGTLYVTRPFRREMQFQLDFLGSASLPISVSQAMVGTTRYYQIWLHDAAGSFGVGLSNAMRVTFCP